MGFLFAFLFLRIILHSTHDIYLFPQNILIPWHGRRNPKEAKEMSYEEELEESGKQAFNFKI